MGPDHFCSRVVLDGRVVHRQRRRRILNDLCKDGRAQRIIIDLCVIRVRQRNTDTVFERDGRSQLLSLGDSDFIRYRTIGKLQAHQIAAVTIVRQRRMTISNGRKYTFFRSSKSGDSTPRSVGR